MMSLWKDILAAFMMGMVLPGILLNITVMGLQRETTIEDIHITIPQETEVKKSSLPVLLCREDGRIDQIDMEEYLTGVVLAEMPATFQQEALKAQFVAARTFARKAWETGGKHGDHSVCVNSGCCQAYILPEEYLQNGGKQENLEKVKGAGASTAGECLQYKGELIEATYFSCSGGSTEDAVAVWGTDYPYLQAVDSPGEEHAKWHTDTVIFTREQFCRALGQEPDGPVQNWFGLVTYTEGGGVDHMVIGEVQYTGTQLRSLLGLRSTAFEIDVWEERILITTRGYGHRVGMSQYGAEAMAADGCSYREILAHYYPGTELVTVFPD